MLTQQLSLHRYVNAPFIYKYSVQDIRDEETEWTDYDSDELVVKFRISDSIFENLLRETLSVFAAIDSRS